GAVVLLPLLPGHPLDPPPPPSGYSHRAVLELQLAACLAIHELTAGSRGGLGAPGGSFAPAAGGVGGRLARWGIARTGSAPALAAALAAAGSLRQAIPGYVVAPTHEFVQHLRTELVTGRPGARAPGLPRARAPTPPAGTR